MRKAKLLWKFILWMLLVPFLAVFVLFLELFIFLLNAIINFEFHWKEIDSFNGMKEEWRLAISYLKRNWNED